jgi:glycosyltransferase involved in cell wall biosynthesis
MVLILAPLFFDGRQNGIGRLSGAVAAAFDRHFKEPCRVWGINDRIDAKRGANDRAFGGRFLQVIGAALVAPKPEGVKLIFATHLGLSSAAWILARRWKVPFAIFLHGVECWGKYPLRTEFAMRRAAGFCSNSEFTLRTFRKAHPSLAHVPARTTLLAVPKDFKPLVGVGVKPPRQIGLRRILAVGRIVRSEGVEAKRLGARLYKGFRPLIEANELLAKRGCPAEVRIVGDGDARQDLETWAKEFVKESKVTFLGKLSDADLAQEYAGADLFALPSEREGFGYVFVEAMANGLPCVCIKNTAPEEIVQDGVTGLAAIAGDIEDLAAKLGTLLKDDALRLKMGEASYQRYLNTFQAHHFEERFISALVEMKILSPT